MSSTNTPSLGMTFGSVYIGTTIAAIFFGITNLQAAIYYKRYPKDGRIYRYSVWACSIKLLEQVAILWYIQIFLVSFSTMTVLVGHYFDKIFPWFVVLQFIQDIRFLINVKDQVYVNALLAMHVPTDISILLNSWKDRRKRTTVESSVGTAIKFSPGDSSSESEDSNVSIPTPSRQFLDGAKEDLNFRI
ncbi:uncharacterized protein EV420DRAFT_1485321 [Desarmillaria tabescens]|uniref:Uncharacterized protein n=1 Tax=Armillaria tabescens TaxID=1929756 RepID=A0AA39JID0_ARMTA|nr:uncharacterized protein EV420DRAFT_1485321 [Desarmillaria tabescens]KAK0442500.1 hypothetical protein EV420DRAFT_1485321 [Desarmillaria tabescens]